MKKLLCSLTLLLLAWFIIDRAGAVLMERAYHATHYAKARKLCQIADSVEADVVLFGTSRCEFHYVPSILQDTLGMRVYNAGIDASSNIYSQYVALSLLLAHHTPRVVCLDTGESEFAAGENDFEPLAVFAPFLGRDAAADSVLCLSGKMPFYRLSHLYRYHSNADQVLGGLFTHADAEEDQGFHPLPVAAIPFSDYADSPQPPCDSLKLHLLRYFIERCRELGIVPVLVISPSLARIGEGYYSPLRTLAADCGVPLLDYDTPGLFMNRPELFRDHAHLCGEGARRFSAIFAGDLRRLLQMKQDSNNAAD